MEDPKVRQLIESLEVLVAISEAQSASLAESRDRAKRIEEMFDRRMSGLDASSSVEPAFSVECSMAQLSDLQATTERSRQREEAMLSAFAALMHLWSVDDLRSKSEAVFERLRQIRMIDVEDSVAGFPTVGLERLKGPQDLTKDQRRQSIRDAMMSHHDSLRGWMHARQLEWDEKIERSDRLLGEALGIARSMLNS